MSFTDPIFTILSFLVGGLICLLSGSLTLLTLLVNPEGANAEFVILISLIAFGFGAATVQITVGPVQNCLNAIGLM
ncbi:hypothetical protein DMJ13_25755 [halophilic archaeon]|nr:hypothetical protein DMJ13_25755 [halophilic archaeon]